VRGVPFFHFSLLTSGVTRNNNSSIDVDEKPSLISQTPLAGAGACTAEDCLQALQPQHPVHSIGLIVKVTALGFANQAKPPERKLKLQILFVGKSGHRLFMAFLSFPSPDPASRSFQVFVYRTIPYELS